MSVTIRDVAKRLNLSITTVSRALDGYDDVAEETRQKVIQVAREMGYTPNQAARQLRRKRSETIGYILPANTPRFSDPFFSEFIAGLGDEAAQQNYDLLISSASPGGDAERLTYQRWVHARRVDGFVLNRIRLHDWRVQYLAEANAPFVTLERTLDPVDHLSVEVDGQSGVKNLVKYLVDKGHQRIAYIGASPELAIQASRYAGYRNGLHETGLRFRTETVIEGDLTRRGGYRATQKLLSLEERPTAIICINDLTAIGAIQAAQEIGLVVGDDIAIAGFDGVEESENIKPPLTTIKQPIYDIARELVKILLTDINDLPFPSDRLQLSPELIFRESTG